MFARLTALFLLALGLAKTLLLRFDRSSALLGFRERYGSDEILGITREESVVLSQAGACTACGRCDQDEGARVARSEVGYRGMMAFVLSGTRSLTDYGAAARSISELPESAFEMAESLCPERVPLVRLAALVRGHAARSSQT